MPEKDERSGMPEGGHIPGGAEGVDVGRSQAAEAFQDEGHEIADGGRGAIGAVVGAGQGVRLEGVVVEDAEGGGRPGPDEFYQPTRAPPPQIIRGQTPVQITSNHSETKKKAKTQAKHSALTSQDAENECHIPKNRILPTIPLPSEERPVKTGWPHQ